MSVTTPGPGLLKRCLTQTRGEVLMEHLDSAEQVDALFLDAWAGHTLSSWRVKGDMTLYSTPIWPAISTRHQLT